MQQHRCRPAYIIRRVSLAFNEVARSLYKSYDTRVGVPSEDGSEQATEYVMEDGDG